MRQMVWMRRFSNRAFWSAVPSAASPNGTVYGYTSKGRAPPDKAKAGVIRVGLLCVQVLPQRDRTRLPWAHLIPSCGTEPEPL